MASELSRVMGVAHSHSTRNNRMDHLAMAQKRDSTFQAPCQSLTVLSEGKAARRRRHDHLTICNNSTSNTKVPAGAPGGGFLP